MKKNKLASLLSIPLFVFSGSCNNSKNIHINNSSYKISKDKIIQTPSSFLEDSLIKVGIVSDIEGAIPNANSSAKKLKKENIDAIIIAGDCYENENIRKNPLYPNSVDNSEEMFEGIKPYAELGKPVFIIPGNHETQKVYSKTIKKLKKDYPNVFDINNKTIDLQGLNLVGMGGYHNQKFMPREGFETNYKKSKNALVEFQSQGEYIIFVTHGPPKSNRKIDWVSGAGHVGDKNMAKILNRSDLEKIVNVHGHIHEGGRNADKFKSGYSINVSSITSYNNDKGSNTSELIFNKNNMDYKILK